MKSLIFVALMALSSIAGAVTQVTDRSFEKEVLQAKGPVVLELYATWCGPCKATAPMIEAAEKKLNGKVKFVKLDVDESPKIGQQVPSIPTIVFVKDGKVLGVAQGAPPNADAIVELANKVFGLEGK